MVVQWSEVRTAWQDSDFITECLCWHNVYRQRHGAGQLYMAPEVGTARPDCDFATECLFFDRIGKLTEGEGRYYLMVSYNCHGWTPERRLPFKE